MEKIYIHEMFSKGDVWTKMEEVLYSATHEGQFANGLQK
jgi:hypothetical protein